jgi:hypothetical protein
MGQHLLPERALFGPPVCTAAASNHRDSGAQCSPASHGRSRATLSKNARMCGRPRRSPQLNQTIYSLALHAMTRRNALDGLERCRTGKS